MSVPVQAFVHCHRFRPAGCSGTVRPLVDCRFLCERYGRRGVENRFIRTESATGGSCTEFRSVFRESSSVSSGRFVLGYFESRRRCRRAVLVSGHFGSRRRCRRTVPYRGLAWRSGMGYRLRSLRGAAYRKQRGRTGRKMGRRPRRSCRVPSCKRAVRFFSEQSSELSPGIHTRDIAAFAGPAPCLCSVDCQTLLRPVDDGSLRPFRFRRVDPGTCRRETAERVRGRRNRRNDGAGQRGAAGLPETEPPVSVRNAVSGNRTGFSVAACPAVVAGCGSSGPATRGMSRLFSARFLFRGGKKVRL